MKVAFYNHTSVVSGAEISLLLTAKHLSEAEPVLFAPEGELLERAREAGIETVALPSYRARLSKNPLVLLRGMLGMLGAGYRFARTVRSHKPDLIHANSLRAGIMAALFAWLHKRPLIWHVRDNPPGGFVGCMIQFVSKRSVKALIGISKSVLNAFDRGHFGDRLHLVHNGVELREMDEAERRTHRIAVREQLQTPPDSRVLAIIGQIAPWKRQEDAIKAAARLYSEGHDIYLWVVGEAKFRQENIDYEAHLRRLAAELNLGERVRFTGFRKDVMEVCCAADLLLLCSENEPFGRVLIEAMSQGVPVVATNGGGVPEIVAHGADGYLYETGDVDALAGYASDLLAHPEARETMGKSAAERVKRHFTIERTVGRIEEIYREVLHERRAVTPAKPRIAIVHDYLNQAGGAERVVGVLHKMFPEAPVYTTILDRTKLLPELRDADIRVTWAQRIPGILKRFKLFFWLYPFAVRSMKLKGYDLILSSSSAYAKGAPKPEGSVHICYCHTPMRFAWDFAAYMDGVKVFPPLKWTANLLQIPLRLWDASTSRRVDYLIANSSVVQQRIKQLYGRSSRIIHPPVNVSRFEVNNGEAEDYLLVVSRLVSYKRIDLAVEACTRLGRPLIVIGEGPDRMRLESLAGPAVKFMGRLPDEQVVHYMRHCQALLFPGLEDFGITPLEANACGRPVIAYRGGGALDTVVPGLNGIYFEEQTVDSLASALQAFECVAWNPAAIRRHAESFDESRFCLEMSEFIAHAMRARLGTANAPMLQKAKFEGSVGS